MLGDKAAKDGQLLVSKWQRCWMGKSPEPSKSSFTHAIGQKGPPTWVGIHCDVDLTLMTRVCAHFLKFDVMQMLVDEGKQNTFAEFTKRNVGVRSFGETRTA